MLWELLFDVPTAYATELGYTRAVHSSDFRGEDVEQAGTYHDPVTGLLMLEPSTRKVPLAANFKPLSSFNFNAGAFQPTQRAVDPTGSLTALPLMSTVRPAGAGPSMIQLLTEIAIISLLNPAVPPDLLYPALQATFSLAANESFAIHYHGLSDEMFKYRNWFGVQFGNCFLHVNLTGEARAYFYPLSSAGVPILTAPPVLLDKWDFAEPGALIGSHGAFWLLPIPGYGILFYHDRHVSNNSLLSSNANSHSTSGHLIAWPQGTVAGVANTVTPAGSPLIALNPNIPMLLGWETVTFSTASPGGTFADSAFDPGYVPSAVPSSVAAVTLPNLGGGAGQSAAATLRTPDDTAAWAAGDRQGRVQLALSSTDTRYTPFVYGYGCQWPYVQTTRGTTATAPDGLLRLEYAVDEYGRFDGTADVLMQSAACRAIVERGDTTWQLRYSADGGTTWNVVAGGLADFSDMELVVDGAGAYYKGPVALRDNWQRLREVHQMLDTAFDGVNVLTAINTVLASAGFGPLLSTPASMTGASIAGTPADLTHITLPPSTTSGWSFGPRTGDDGEHLLQTFLLLMRWQNHEYALYYDWAAQGWRLADKARDATAGGTWTLTAFSDEDSPAARVVRVMGLTLTPQKPEANVVTCTGVTTTDPRAVLVKSAPAVNGPSLTDPTSPDYLGRAVLADFQVEGLTQQSDVNAMARRIADAVTHRRLKGRCQAQDFVPGLGPNTQVNVRALDATGNRATLYTLWIKKVGVIVETDGQETASYDLDSNWYGELEQ